MIRAAADDLERTAERFGDYIKLERACSENTRRAYLSDLSIWTAWCRRNSRDPLDVQADAVFWDETLTGNNGDGADIYAYPLVAQFTIGVCAVYDRFMLSVFQAFRSKDFSSQDKDFFAYGGFKFSVFF